MPKFDPDLPSSSIRRVSRHGALGLTILWLSAAALPAEPKGHLGQDVREHVTVSTSVQALPSIPCSPQTLVRVLPGGAIEGLDFTGKLFVVTDVSWRAFALPELEVDKVLNFNVFYGTDIHMNYASSILVTN